MFDVSINFEDISLVSLNTQDILPVRHWLEEQNCNDSTYEYLNLNELPDRFLESYVSEGELFVKIVENDEIIGILKGRIEFKNPNEMWILYYIIDNKLRKKGIGSKILNYLLNYFSDSYCINDVYAIVVGDDCGAEYFWSENGFKVYRISDNYLENGGKPADMHILKKV